MFTLNASGTKFHHHFWHVLSWRHFEEEQLSEWALSTG